MQTSCYLVCNNKCALYVVIKILFHSNQPLIQNYLTHAVSHGHNIFIMHYNNIHIIDMYNRDYNCLCYRNRLYYYIIYPHDFCILTSGN